MTTDPVSYQLIVLSAVPLTPAAEQALTHWLAQQNFTIVDKQLLQESLPHRVTYRLAGSPSASATREQLLALSAEFTIELALQVVAKTDYKLACFDMDSTLINAEVIDELAKEAGVGERVSAITESAMRGEIDFNQSFEQRMALLKGLDESVLASVADRLELNDGAETLIKALQARGCKTAILSGGFDYFGRFLQAKLGFDDVYANQLEIVDGKVTGQVIEPVVNGERKAALLTELAERQSITLSQVVAVGDGANDLAMLGLAGLGVAFRAKPLVRQAAQQSINYLGLDAIVHLLGE